MVRHNGSHHDASEPRTPRPPRARRSARAGRSSWHCPGRCAVTAWVAVGPGAAAGARRRSVTVVLVRRPLPQTTGELAVPGLDGRRRGGARRARHPAAVRRLGRRPDARPGLRARAGAVLRDGRAPARDRRPARRRCSARTRSRATRWCARWAGAGSPSGSWRCSSPQTRAALEAYAARRQRLPRPALAQRDRGGVHRCSASAGSTTRPETWTPGRLAGLAQGDGLGPARQHRRRDRPGPRARRPRRGRGRELYPAYPYARARADRRPGRRRRRRLRAGRHHGRHPQPAAPGVHRRPARSRCAGCAAGSAGCPPCSAAATASAPTAGSSTASTPRPASPLLANDPHLAASLPGVWMQMGLHCTHGLARPARSTSPGFTFSGVPGRGDRPQRRHRLGLHQPRPRRHRPLPREGRAATAGATTASGGRCSTRTETIKVAGGDDVTLHGALDPARPAALRRLRPARRRRASRRRSTGGRAPTTGLRRRAAVDRAAPGADRRRDPRPRHRPPTGTPSGAAAASFAVPAQNLVYADRAGHIGYQAPGPGADPQVRQRRAGAVGRAGGPENDWTGDYVPVRRAAQRARPGRGVRRHRQPGRDRPGLPLPAHRRLGPRLPLAADPRPARAGGRALASTRWPRSSSTPATRPRRCWCPTCSTSSCRAATTATGQRLLRRLGLHPARRQRRRRRTSTSVWRNVLARPSTTTCPRSCGPTAATAGSRSMRPAARRTRPRPGGTTRPPTAPSRPATTSWPRR